MVTTIDVILNGLADTLEEAEDRVRAVKGQLRSLAPLIAAQLEPAPSGFPLAVVATALDAFVAAHDPDATDPVDRGWLPENTAALLCSIAQASADAGHSVQGFPAASPAEGMPTEQDLVAILDAGIGGPTYSPAQRDAWLSAIAAGAAGGA